MTTYYEYRHRPGYGRDDHMADEVIARAARRLGSGGCDDHIAASLGLVSHPVPLGGVEYRMPAAPGVRRRMERALSAAQQEFARRQDCWVYVACVRERNGVREVRRGSRWEQEDSDQ